MWNRKAILILYLALFAEPVWGRVLLRWSEPALPSAKVLGVRDLVVPWGTSQNLIESAREQGYHVYAEVILQQASAAAAQSSKTGISGIVLKVGDSNDHLAREALTPLQIAYPRLAFLILGPAGKQPQMRGSTVIKQDGVFEVSSPTAQPWIDSNTALVAFDRALRPAQIPLFDFAWELSDAVERQRGPSADDYLLAVAEAGALHADLIMDVHPSLQKALAQGNSDGGTAWTQVKRYLEFYSQEGKRSGVTLANVGVVTDNFEASYEAMNLLARRNIPFRVLTPGDLMSQGLKGLDLIVVFAKPDEKAAREVTGFVAAGGTAVLVNLHGSFPWQSGEASRTGEHSVSYTLGGGKAIELSEDVDDPETFAQDVRRLLSNEKSLISLWNALTTLAVPYQHEGRPDVTLELINYAEDPLQVQVRIKGSFTVVRYENPEHGCCEYLKPTRDAGFTEFVIPWLKIGGRVHLSPAGTVPAAAR
jgi:hypothetical protein